MLAKTRNRIQELERRVKELEQNTSVYVLTNSKYLVYKWVHIKDVIKSLLDHLNLDIRRKRDDNPIIIIPKEKRDDNPESHI